MLTATLDGLCWPWLLLLQLAAAGWVWQAFDWTPHAPLALSWATLLAGLLVAQSVFAWRLRARLQQALNPQIEFNLTRFGCSQAAIGVLWAIGLVMLFNVTSEPQRLYVVFATIGIGGAQIALQHHRPLACYPVVLTPLAALTICYALAGQWLVTALLLLLVLLAIRLIQRLATYSAQATTFQVQQHRLLDQLAAQTQSLADAKQSADSANASKSRFLAQASHDLRQPLHAIGLFVESIAQDQEYEQANDQECTQDKKKEIRVAKGQVFTRVQQSLAMLSKLFDNLLDITALDTQEVSVTPVNMAVQDLFDQLATEFEPVAREANVSLTFRASSSVIQSDYVLLRRLLQNLVANAIRYSPGGSVLTGVRREEEGSVKIQVYDTGIGIPVDQQSRVFDEFVRLKVPATEREPSNPGLGLGLSIVHRLASALGVSVSLTSHEGRGSVFTVSGILQADGKPVRLDENLEQDTSDLLEGARVLVVDDDEVVLQATGEVLRGWGCEVQLFQQAPEHIAQVDVLISDQELADGKKGLAEIARLANSHDFAGVLITGNSSPELQKLARQAHVPLLHKPVRPIQLRSALLHALSMMSQ